MSQKKLILTICSLLSLAALSLFFWCRVNTVNPGVYLSSSVAAELTNQKVFFSNKESFRDTSETVIYTAVDSKTLDRLASAPPQTIWKSCKLLTPQSKCYDSWLSIKELWALKAKLDPRSYANKKPGVLKIAKQLEDSPDTRCSLVAVPYFDAGGGQQVVQPDAVAYLCLSRKHNLLQLDIYTG